MPGGIQVVVLKMSHSVFRGPRKPVITCWWYDGVVSLRHSKAILCDGKV